MRTSKAWLLAGLSLAALAPIAAVAGEAGEAGCPVPSCGTAPAAGGQIAIINPDTGELMGEDVTEAAPGSEELAATITEFNAQMSAEMLQQFSSEGLVEQRIATGGVKADLEGRFQAPLTVVIAPDGTPHFGHGQVAVPQAD